MDAARQAIYPASEFVYPWIADELKKADQTRLEAEDLLFSSHPEDWKLAEFITTTRTPIDPNGHEPSEEMPWRPIGRMDDDELAAVYEFLAHLPVLNMPAIYRATRLPCASRYRCYWT